MTLAVTSERRPALPLPVVALLAALAVAGCGVSTSQPAGPAVAIGQPAPTSKPTDFPNADDSFKFVVLGDWGSGEPGQFELVKQMTALHGRFKYDLVVTVGDNIYGAERPQDFAARFERPFKPLLDAGVKFRAALGNHDGREQRKYELFGMEDRLYYSHKAPRGSIRFYALESSYMLPEQVKWLEEELKSHTDEWKIVHLHHALYSSARHHGNILSLRKVLEPLFVRYNVSVVFQGHDHTYERTKPQQGVVYFVAGSGGKLRRGDLNRRSPFFENGFDQDLVFFAGEISGDNMVFQAISRTGQVVDSGIVIRRKEAPPTVSVSKALPSLSAG
jgi:predicted MPP superfamily phosphohydrolase